MNEKNARDLDSSKAVVIAALLSGLTILGWAGVVGVLVGGPAMDPMVGTLFWCGLPAAVMSIIGLMAWGAKHRGIAVAVWGGGIGTAIVIALPVFFSLSLSQSSL